MREDKEGKRGLWGFIYGSVALGYQMLFFCPSFRDVGYDRLLRLL